MAYNCSGCGKELIQEDGTCVEKAYFDRALNLDRKVHSWCERCYESRSKEVLPGAGKEKEEEEFFDVESYFW